MRWFDPVLAPLCEPSIGVKHIETETNSPRSHIACTGHSMGGSLCDLFAACANSQRSLPDTPQHHNILFQRLIADARGVELRCVTSKLFM